MQEGPDQQESITALQLTAQWWLLQVPSASSVKGFVCTSKTRNLCAGFAAAGNLACYRGKGGSKSLASFDFLLKGKEVNCTSFGWSAMPSNCSVQQTVKREEIPKETTL